MSVVPVCRCLSSVLFFLSVVFLFAPRDDLVPLKTYLKTTKFLLEISEGSFSLADSRARLGQVHHGFSYKEH